MTFQKLFASVGVGEITLCRSGSVKKHFAAVQNRKVCLVGEVLSMESRDVGFTLMHSQHLIFLSLTFLPVKQGLQNFLSGAVLSYLHCKHFGTGAIFWLSCNPGQ